MAFADACRRGDSACLKVFLSHGANVNGQFDGTSPLGLAAASGSLDSVKLLLDNGADAGSLGIRYLQTPLFCAAAAPHPIAVKTELIQLLLDHGANINGVSIVDAQSVTVLSHACSSNDVDLVRWLLERGADPDLPFNQSAVAICIREPQDPLRRDMLVRLMERADLAVNRGYAHLVFALHHCNLTAVELLLA
jgi:ankyrin repeat protein